MNLDELYRKEIKKLKNVPVLGKDKVTYWQQLIPKLCIEKGDWAEFGVYKGISANILLKSLPEDSHFYLFDSFEGLPEDWDHKDKKGSMALTPEQIPVFDDNRVYLQKGLFEDTLPKYFNKESWLTCPYWSLFHIDCDVYSSAKTVLKNIDGFICYNTFLLLDDYCNGSEKHKHHMFKAFQEYIQSNGYTYTVLFKSPSGSQVTVRIEK